MQPRILAVAAILPYTAVDGFRIAFLPLCPKQVAVFKRKQDVVRIFGLQASEDLKRLIQAALAAKKYYENDLRINAGLGIAGSGGVKVLQALLFISPQTDDTRRSLHSPRQISDHIIV